MNPVICQSKYNYTHIFLFLFLISFLSSCIPQRKIKYLQELDTPFPGDTTAFNTNSHKNRPEYRIQPNDYLFITVNGLNEEITRIFHGPWQ